MSRLLIVSQELSGTWSADFGGRFGLVVSRYNRDVTDGLLDGARRTLQDQGVDPQAIDVVWVPGSWEIPLAARWMALSQKYTALICLGAVIQGQTTHDQQINRFVSMALGNMSLEFGIPVTFGVLTCPNRALALSRAGGAKGNKGIEAAQAALEMAALRRAIG